MAQMNGNDAAARAAAEEDVMCANSDRAMGAGAGYALFIDLNGREVVVVGGGPVAERKVRTVLPFGANVTVVSPKITEGLKSLEGAGSIRWIPREYERGDLSDARMVFSACGVPEVDDLVKAEADEVRALLNVVDVPSKCEFIVPSTVERGPLRIAVSTSGCAPTEAKRIRRQLEAEFDESWEPYLNLMQDVRTFVKERIVTSDEDRKPVFEAAVRAGWRERIAAGEEIDAESAYAEALSGSAAAAASKQDVDGETGAIR